MTPAVSQTNCDLTIAPITHYPRGHPRKLQFDRHFKIAFNACNAFSACSAVLAQPKENRMVPVG